MGQLGEVLEVQTTADRGEGVFMNRRAVAAVGALDDLAEVVLLGDQQRGEVDATAEPRTHGEAPGGEEVHLEHGQAAQSKHARVSIQNKRFTLVNNKKGEELFDLKNDPGETTNVIAQYPEVVAQLRAVYDQWWTRMQPGLVNEDAYQPPAK